MSVIRGVGVESNKATKGGQERVSGGASTIISTQTRQVLLSRDYITPTLKYIKIHLMMADRGTCKSVFMFRRVVRFDFLGLESSTRLRDSA